MQLPAPQPLLVRQPVGKHSSDVVRRVKHRHSEIRNDALILPLGGFREVSRIGQNPTASANNNRTL